MTTKTTAASSRTSTFKMSLAAVLVAAGSVVVAGCFAEGGDGPEGESESAQTACLACDGEGLEAEDIDLPVVEDGDGGTPAPPVQPPANAWDGGGGGLQEAPAPAAPPPDGGFGAAFGISIKNDTIVPVGNVRVAIPQLKGDRCHAGGAAVHITITDANRNVYKMVPVNEGGKVVWKTVDGRPGPSRSVMKAILGNQRVVSAMAKIAKFMGLGCGAIVFFGYDSYVSAGETSGLRILDKIKSLRSVQDICSPDENGIVQPVLPRNGTVAGGAPSGNDLKWEVIWDRQYGWIYTTYYYVPDCTWLERRFGCVAVKKVWVIGPDQHQQIPNGCLQQ